MVCTTSIEATEHELVDRVREASQAVTAVLRDRIAQAQADGELAADKDPERLARFLFNTNMGLTVLGRAGFAPDVLRDIAEHAIESVFDG